MKILFTGASSFTGYWFVKFLSNKGNEVYATFTKDSSKEYEGIIHKRVEKVTEFCNPVWNCKFGSEKFLDVINQVSFDVICHHAADVKNYKNPKFDFASALKNNTYNIRDVFEVLNKTHCKSIILTGSVFEQNEGCGTKSLRAFSPYGLSKGLTSEVFKHFSEIYKIKLGKFVISNPFGPFEEPRFTTYLIKNWIQEKIPVVNTPKYIRDNIHVSLLSKVYSYFIERVYNESKFFQKINPSGYVESQASFTKRFSNEIRKRTNLKCEYKLNDQTYFPEPEIRINTDMAKNLCEDWDEEKAWDELVEFYNQIYF